MMDFAIPAQSGATVLRKFNRDDANIAELVDLYAGAYSVMDLGTAEKRERYEKRLREEGIDEPGNVTVGAYRDGVLVGAMDWYDYTMRLRDRDVFAGGLGSVAVALDARRRGIAADMVRAFIEAYRARGATMALLHPFRHDFYRRFGFGYGTKMNSYRLAPAQLPEHPAAHRVRQLRAEEADVLARCYERVRVRSNGLILTSADDFRKELDSKLLRIFGYFDAEAELRGYLMTRPLHRDRENSRTELHVYEPIVEHPEAMAALLGFLRGLSDQFELVVVRTQDDALYIAAHDPRDASGDVLHPPAYHETNAQGSGIMYRVLDVPRALETLSADSGQSAPNVWATLKIDDPLIAANSEPFDLGLYEGGCPRGVTLTLDIADFSSLLAGSVRLRSFYRYGLASVSAPEAVGPLDRFFAAESPPLCTTHF